MEDWGRTVISQFANSPTMLALISSFNDWVDPAADIDLFYANVWDLDTATGIGLDIWGRIVGISRVLGIPSYGPFLGFSEANEPLARPFGEAPFFNGIVGTQNYVLSDDIYRKIIYVKAASNISASNAQALNQLLQALFAERGRCYVNDYGQMTMRYEFEFQLQPYELALVQGSILPHPSGVNVLIHQIQPRAYFGFAEAGPTLSAPFGQQTFYPGPTS